MMEELAIGEGAEVVGARKPPICSSGGGGWSAPMVEEGEEVVRARSSTN